MPTSIFSDEWRECLIAHYTHVLRSNDQRTERTLRGVMLDVGFTESDLSQIYVAATAHVDDLPEDFTPDSRFVESIAAAALAEALETPADPAEVIADPPVDMPFIVDDPPFDDADDSTELLALDESELLDESEIEDDLSDDESQDDEAPPADPDSTQLSLF